MKNRAKYRWSIKRKHPFIYAFVRYGCIYDCIDLHRMMRRGDSDSSSIVHFPASACLSLISEREAFGIRRWSTRPCTYVHLVDMSAVLARASLTAKDISRDGRLSSFGRHRRRPRRHVIFGRSRPEMPRRIASIPLPETPHYRPNALRRPLYLVLSLSFSLFLLSSEIVCKLLEIWP